MPDDLYAQGDWTHHFFDANGVRLHAACAGFDPAVSSPHTVVILLHSFPEHWYAWREVLRAARGSSLALVAPDLRGYGLSDKPPRGFATPGLADDIIGLVAALGAHEAILVGHGLGGVVARAAAAAAPQICRHVIAISSPHPANWRLPRREAAAAKWIAWAQIPFVAERLLTRGNAVQHFITDLTAPSSPARAMIGSYRSALRSPFAARCALEQIRWLVRFRRRREGRRFLAELERSYWMVPVTELAGKHDAFWPRETFAADARPVDAGFFIPEEAPQAVLAAIKDAAATLRNSP